MCCIWSKRLEQGQFHGRFDEGVKRALDWTDLKLIIEGIVPVLGEQGEN